MIKKGYTGTHTKRLALLMAILLGLSVPCTAAAVEQGNEPEKDSTQSDSGQTVEYIVSFEALSEEDSCFVYPEKYSLEEVQGSFPLTIMVKIEGDDSVVEIPVTWECEEDFDNTALPSYIFYPKWDETRYAVAESAKDSAVLPYIMVEIAAGYGMLPNLKEAQKSLEELAQEKCILALIYLCDEYDVMKEASWEAESLVTVACGKSVQILGAELDENGSVWYRVLLYQDEAEYEGYVIRDCLATSDEDFMAWEDTYIDLSSVPMRMSARSRRSPDIDQFPASYQNALYSLKEQHPAWVFIKMDTGIDWNSAVANELGNKSLISSSCSGSWQNGTYVQGWSYASEGILKYYMDPRNFLTDPAIFQFEHLNYNESYHTTAAVQEILKNSFMSSTIPGDSITYAQAFVTIGKSYKTSPFHLASRVLQEQGKGTSPLISGTYPGYEGYYNYFNVQASGKTNAEVIVNGLKAAVKYGWDTRYKSLNGGGSLVGVKYISTGQDTIYLQKFNVSNGIYPNFTHQYMQNIQAPASEASNVRKAYNNAGALENSFVFKIPVYENMPASACSKPEVTDAITLDKTIIDSLEVNKTVTLIPYVNGSEVDYVSDMTFTSSNTAVASVDGQGKITAVSPGTATISCTRKGANTASCTVTVIKANPSVVTPVLSPVSYQDGLRLSDIALPDGWAWTQNTTAITKAGTFSYAAVYTPADTVKYNTLTKNISFTVTKAVPNCQVPGTLEIKAGTTLGAIALPAGFAWESDPETLLETAGEYTYYVSYNPDESKYHPVGHIPVIVHVSAQTQEPSGDNSGGTTSTGTTSGGTTSSGTTSTGTTSTGTTSTGTTSNGTISTGTTSTGTTSTGTMSTGTTSNGTTSTGTTSTGTTSTGTTSTGTTSSGTTSTGTTSTGTTSTGTTSTGTTSSGTTSSGNDNTAATAPSSGNATVTAAGPSAETGTGSATASTQPTGSAATAAPSDSNAPAGSNVAGNSVTKTPSVGQGRATAENKGTSGSAGTAGELAGDGAAEESGMQSFSVEESVSEKPVYVKPAVLIQMDDTSVLTVEAIQMAKEQGFDLLLDMGNQISWDIDVDRIDRNALAEVDMGVTLGTQNIPRELIEILAEGNETIAFSLAHDGEFPFAPVLNIMIDPIHSGRYANLFYYRPGEEYLEFICAGIIDESGMVSFDMWHASDYVIIISDQTMEGMLISEDSPGHIGRWILIGVLIFMSFAVVGYGIFFLLKRRQEDEYEEEDEDNDQEYEENRKYDEEWEYNEYDDVEETPARETKTVRRDTARAKEYDDEAVCEDTLREEYDGEAVREDTPGEGDDDEAVREDTPGERYDDEAVCEDTLREEYDSEAVYEDALDEEYDDEAAYEDVSGAEEYVDEAVRGDAGRKREYDGSTRRGSARERTASSHAKMTRLSQTELEDMETGADEDDWIEDDDWKEPIPADQDPMDRFADDHAEDDWIDDDEWDIGNDWMDDEEWERKNSRK